MIKKVLIVWSSKDGSIAPFVQEQIESLNKKDINCKLLIIKGGGVIGYLKSYFKILIEVIKQKPDIVHAHFGLAGFICGFLPFRPVITTFHGSDIMNDKTRFISKMAAFLSSEYILVSETLKEKAKLKKGFVIPCGIDMEFFKPSELIAARKQLNLKHTIPIVLFGSNKKRLEKNFELAERSFKIFKIKYPDAEMICLNGFSRKEVELLLNAADAAFLTSKWEGSPQFIKEAMATSTPIVSTNVGDIKERTSGVEACYLINMNNTSPEQIASYLEACYLYRREKTHTNGRDKLTAQELSLKYIASKINNVYLHVLNGKKNWKE